VAAVERFLRQHDRLERARRTVGDQCIDRGAIFAENGVDGGQDMPGLDRRKRRQCGAVQQWVARHGGVRFLFDLDV
jgi:hypothetical protein